MITLNQVIRGKRIKLKKKVKFPKLYGCPQKRGECKKVFIMSPKKPNSASRRVAKLFIRSKNEEIIVYIPGEGTNIKERDSVVYRGCNVKDLPGIKYKAILGVHNTDIKGLNYRRNKLSKYGIKNEKVYKRKRLL
uniref:Ribosomal protein S12 n=1 Tax=Babesia rodhaini TaxID=5870 RepID=A0A455QZB9_BABRO|nr:ribosomal protein S12 [Babesia rodhaini]